jgi:hypothetical protein
MGVMSLLLGAASMLVNGMLLLQLVMMYRMSQATAAMANASAASTAAMAAPVADTTEALPPRGMPVAQRRIVAEGLGNVRTLSEQRTAQLDLLLAEGGKDIFLLSGAALTPQAIAANVSESAKIPGVAGREGPDVFVVGQGRMELYDDHAAFFPSRGGEVIRVAGLREDSSGTKTLGASQVQLIQAKVEKLAGMKLNAAQSTALTTSLASPGQQLVTPAASMADIAAQVQYATAQDDGSILIGFASSAITLDAVGKVTAFSSALGGMSGRGGGKPQNFAINPAAGTLAVADCVVSILLAVFLCFAGVQVFREARQAAGAHRIYAWVKLPIAIASAIVWAWLWSSFLKSIQTATGGTLTPNQSFAIKMVTLAGIAIGLSGAIYPIVLLLALRGRTMRDYYGGVVAE